jgi:uncharacterized DUF497 family protein
MAVRFEWDSRKAAANLRTHGVSFAEAVTALEDDFALTREDGADGEEQRFVTAGAERCRESARRGVRVSRAGHHPGDLSLEAGPTPERTL